MYSMYTQPQMTDKGSDIILHLAFPQLTIHMEYISMSVHISTSYYGLGGDYTEITCLF